MVQLMLQHAAKSLTPTEREAEAVMMSEKVRPHHLERKALLYVRQSSAHQVLHNRESSTVAVCHAGSPDGTWLVRGRGVIDDDLGRSAAGERATRGI